LLEHELSTDTADQYGERRPLAMQRLVARARGAFRAVDESIEVRFHQLRGRALGHVAGERHRLVLFVDGEDRAHERLAVVRATDAEREQKARRGQTARVIAEVLLVEIECWLAVQLEQHVALDGRYHALRSERVPAAELA